MAIYTKVGDGGDTYRPGGLKTRKGDPFIEALGGLDEMNANVGFCLQALRKAQQQKIIDTLQPVQGELLAAGAILAAADTGVEPGALLDPAAVKRIEDQIDAVWAELPMLKHFILPGGCESACRLHLARVVCRRAERAIVRAADAGLQVPPVVLQYINRLGDLLFTLARLVNHLAGAGETQWTHS